MCGVLTANHKMWFVSWQTVITILRERLTDDNLNFLSDLTFVSNDGKVKWVLNAYINLFVILNMFWI